MNTFRCLTTMAEPTSADELQPGTVIPTHGRTMKEQKAWFLKKAEEARKNHLAAAAAVTGVRWGWLRRQLLALVATALTGLATAAPPTALEQKKARPHSAGLVGNRLGRSSGVRLRHCPNASNFGVR